MVDIATTNAATTRNTDNNTQQYMVCEELHLKRGVFGTGAGDLRRGGLAGLLASRWLNGKVLLGLRLFCCRGHGFARGLAG